MSPPLVASEATVKPIRVVSFDEEDVGFELVDEKLWCPGLTTLSGGNKGTDLEDKDPFARSAELAGTIPYGGGQRATPFATVVSADETFPADEDCTLRRTTRFLSLHDCAQLLVKKHVRVSKGEGWYL